MRREFDEGAAANAHLTPFKGRLHNYRNFSSPSNVKALGGRRVLAQGTGSGTLTDTKVDTEVSYVPEIFRVEAHPNTARSDKTKKRKGSNSIGHSISLGGKSVRCGLQF